MSDLSVAIIEDRTEDRFFLRIALEEAIAGCDVHEFSYAEDALVFLRSPERSQIDVILVDIAMPRMDGFEFASAYYDLYAELKGHTKIYVTTSSIDPADARRAEAHPAIHGFMEKPVTSKMLMEVLRADRA